MGVRSFLPLVGVSVLYNNVNVWIYRDAYCHASGNMLFRYIRFTGRAERGGTPFQIFV